MSLIYYLRPRYGGGLYYYGGGSKTVYLSKALKKKKPDEFLREVFKDELPEMKRLFGDEYMYKLRLILLTMMVEDDYEP